eukprot:jgi/Hompol1/6379/HPOL_004959-RA
MVSSEFAAHETAEHTDCVCYGIGSIAESKLSQYQFALLLLLMDQCKFNAVHLYEPLLTDIENKFIESNGITLITENEVGFYWAPSNCMRQPSGCNP